MRTNKEEIARREGMSYALRVAKEKGIAGLEEELKIRNATNLPVAVSVKAMEECVENIKLNTIDTITILSVATLHDEFGFGEKRIQKFLDRFDLKSSCLCESYVTWDDLIQNIKNELGITLDIRKNDTNVRAK